MSSRSATALRCYTFSEFCAVADEERDGWRWEGLLPASGTVLLVGQPHAGKTTLIAALAAAMSGPKELAGRRVRSGKLLLLSLEHSARDLAQSLRAAARGAGVDDGNLRVQVIRDRIDLGDDSRVKAVAEAIALSKAKVVVIDPFRRSTSIDENRAEEVSRYCETLRKLGGDGKRLIIVIHHMTKNGDMPRGSMDFIASVDSWLRLTRVKPDIIRLEATHHGAARVEVKLLVQRSDDKLIVSEADARTALASEKLKKIVLDVITENPNIGTRTLRKHVREQSRAGHDAIKEATVELEAEKLIENTGSESAHRWQICVGASL